MDRHPRKLEEAGRTPAPTPPRFQRQHCPDDTLTVTSEPPELCESTFLLF